MRAQVLQRVRPKGLPPSRRDPVDADTIRAAASIVEDVRERGEGALREHAERLGDRAPLGQE